MGEEGSLVTTLGKTIDVELPDMPKMLFIKASARRNIQTYKFFSKKLNNSNLM